FRPRLAPGNQTLRRFRPACSGLLVIFSFSGSKTRKGIPSIGVLSQLLEWTCLYPFRPRAVRQRQVHPSVQGQQLRPFFYPETGSWILPHHSTPKICHSACPERSRRDRRDGAFCRPGAEESLS